MDTEGVSLENLKLEFFCKQYKVVCFVVVKNITQKWPDRFRAVSAGC